MNCWQQGHRKRGHTLGAHGLSHRRPWKQDIVVERVLEPRSIAQSGERDWLQVVLLQPVDIRTKYVQVPVVKVMDKYVPKITYQEQAVEVPRIVHKTVQKFVEKPYIKYVDKYQEVPQVRYKYAYVPKETIQERTVYKPKFTVVEKVKYKEKREVRFADRFVEVPELEVALEREANTGSARARNDVADSVCQEEKGMDSTTPRKARPPLSVYSGALEAGAENSDQHVTRSDIGSEYSSGCRCLPRGICRCDSRCTVRSCDPRCSRQPCLCSECMDTT